MHAAFIPTLAELKATGQTRRSGAFVRAMTRHAPARAAVCRGRRRRRGAVPGQAVRAGASPARSTSRLAVRFTRLMFPYLGFISLAALAQGVLNSSGRFLLPAATPLALNLLAVLGTLAAVMLGGAWEWMAFGVLAGGLAQVALQLPACRRAGLPLRPGGGWFRHPEVRRVLALMLPGIPALGVYELTLLVSYRFASSVGPGAITARFNANRLAELVYGSLIVQLTTAALPMLAADRARDAGEARRTLAFALRLLSLVAVPAAVVAGRAGSPGGRDGVRRRRVRCGLGRDDRRRARDVRLGPAVPRADQAARRRRRTRGRTRGSRCWRRRSTSVAFFALGSLWTPVYGVAGIAAAASAGQVVNAATLLLLNGRARRLPSARDVLPAVARHVRRGGRDGRGGVTACALRAAARRPRRVDRGAGRPRRCSGRPRGLRRRLLVALRAPECASCDAELRRGGGPDEDRRAARQPRRGARRRPPGRIDRPRAAARSSGRARRRAGPGRARRAPLRVAARRSRTSRGS